MGSITNQKEVWCIRFLFGIPLVIIIVYANYILTHWELFIMPIQSLVLYIMILLSIFILFLITRVSVPDREDSDEIAEYFIEEPEYQEKVYVIPTVCPKCKTPIKLDRIWWEDEHTPLCQECQSKLKLKIVEK